MSNASSCAHEPCKHLIQHKYSSDFFVCGPVLEAKQEKLILTKACEAPHWNSNRPQPTSDRHSYHDTLVFSVLGIRIIEIGLCVRGAVCTNYQSYG